VTQANPYTVEVDTFESGSWYDRIAGFDDANLYQLWLQGSGDTEFSRIALKSSSGEIVAAAEVRLFHVPLTRRGIAYVLWGPVARRNASADPAVFRHAIRALRDEYVVRRGMVLRINPRLLEGEDEACLAILAEEGFSRLQHVRVSRTLVMDLGPDLDTLRRNFDKKWRNCLSKAERSDLTVTTGTGLDLFDQFCGVYRQLLARKKFDPSADIDRHRRIQESLPEALKMRIVIVSHEGRPCAGAIYSALGDTAVYLFGATDETGMKLSASYLVQWEVLRALKAGDVRRYDLNGIDPENNPGPYHFKLGLAGKTGAAVTFAGQFQAVAPSIGNYSLLLADKARHYARTAMARHALRPATAQ
jgi:hypothetical protein